MPEAFKLDHFQPVEPLLFRKFSNYFTFILGGPILITPERGRLKMGKWNSHNLRLRGGFLWTFKLDYLQPVEPLLFKKNPNISLSYWGPILRPLGFVSLLPKERERVKWKEKEIEKAGMEF